VLHYDRLPGGGTDQSRVVVGGGRKVFAIEVKAASRWSETDLSGLRAFLDRTPACVSAVLAYNGTEAVKLDDKLWAIPMGQLLE